VGAKLSRVRYPPAAVGIGRWKLVVPVALLLATVQSLSLELPAKAAVTMLLSAETSPSMEATRPEDPHGYIVEAQDKIVTGGLGILPLSLLYREWNSGLLV